MPSFRAENSSSPGSALTAANFDLSALRDLLNDLLLPCHFFVSGGLQLEWEHGRQVEIPWEVFRGRLLDPGQTRQRESFEAWNVFRVDAGVRSAEPLVALYLDARANQIHVTRAIYSHAWEGYHAGGNVYLSRQTQKWLRELVGTIELGRSENLAALRDELGHHLFLALVGTSRLPLTSVEAPLPEFSLGQLTYAPCLKSASRDDGQAMRTHADLVARAAAADLPSTEFVKFLEMLLRSTPAEELSDAACLVSEHWRARGVDATAVSSLFRQLFNEVALTPFTDFVAKTLRFVGLLETNGTLTGENHADFLGYLLRQLGRHLTAYDLVTFHHRGANYPDALLLDQVLKAYLERASREPWMWESSATDAPAVDQKRLRRRALRQAWLLRRRYEGHPVPDAPTSPGENARILPSPHVHVPDEQITNPLVRTKRLFAGDPLTEYLTPVTRRLLRQSIDDLDNPQELRELGMAVFLDRPLGVFKAPGEPDQTPLLSYDLFSRAIASTRLEQLRGELDFVPTGVCERLQAILADLVTPGLALAPRMRASPRMGVSLLDAARVADDFMVLRTTSSSAGDLLANLVHGDLGGPWQGGVIVDGAALLAGPPGLLVVFDRDFRRRLELQVDAREGYHSLRGMEYPRPGLRVVRAWDSAGLESQALRDTHTLLAFRG